MHTIRFYEYGGPEVLRYEECEPPRPHHGQVLVALEAAGVNSLDWQIRSGLGVAGGHRWLPAVPGFDFAGRVAAVGPGVQRFRPGDRVFGQSEYDAMGAYAEAVAVSSQRLATVPPDLAMTCAAALPSAALAAWHALFDFGELRPGQSVLILGVSGSTGFLAAQLATLVDDIRLVGACRPERWNGLLDALCTSLVDVQDELALARVRGSFDVVLNLLGEPFERAAIAATKRGGRLVTSAALPDFAACWARGVRSVGLSGHFDRVNLERVAKLVVGGHIRAPQLRIEPLSAAAAVHRMGERRELRGRAVLVPG
jgi:NADPH:quinone reductase-like Zn-dependent oxidoreductase